MSFGGQIVRATLRGWRALRFSPAYLSWLVLSVVTLGLWFWPEWSQAADISLPGVKISTGEAAGNANPEQVGIGLQILLFMTLFSLAPAILIMVTSFTRVIVVISFVRQAMGLQGQPPNQVLISLSLFITFFVMGPVFDRINQDSIQPYIAKTINEEVALERAIAPLRSFMLRQTRAKDLELFMRLAGIKQAPSPADTPLRLIIPAFMISELKTAFQIGFMIYLPFLIIDMVVASVVMSMGMMMLPPLVISMPVKLILFVLVDGWSLVVGSLVQSFK